VLERRAVIASALAVLMVVAAVLRSIGLNEGLWYDEIVSVVMFIRPPLERIVTEYPNSNNHPLYSVLAHVATMAFGEQPWSVRLPSLLFGVLSVPMLYVLARVFTDSREALLSAALLTVSYHHVWFSQNARGYTALAFWAMAATALLVHGWRTRRPVWFVLYGVVSALGIYTHLTMAFAVVAHALILATLAAVAAGEQRRRGIAMAALGLGVAAVGALLLYWPMSAQVYQFFTGPPLETAAVATPRWAIREALRGLGVGMGTIGLLAAAGMSAAGAWSYWRDSRVTAAMLVLPGIVTAAMTFLLGSPIRPRFFFFLIGFAILIVIRGATVLGQGVGRTRYALVANALAGLLIAASLLSLPGGYRYPKQDYEGAMQFVDGIVSSGDVVLTASLATYPYREYYRRAWSGVQSMQELDASRHGSRGVVLLYTFPEYGDPLLMRAVADTCRPIRVFAGTVSGGDVVVCRIGPGRLAGV